MQKRRTGSKERKSDSLYTVWPLIQLCHSTFSTSDRNVIPSVGCTTEAGFSVYTGTSAHYIALFAGCTGLGLA